MRTIYAAFDRSLRAVLLSPFVSQKLGMLASKEDAASLEALRDLIDAGSVTPAIDSTYSLGETAAAIQRIIDGHARGKIVVTLR